MEYERWSAFDVSVFDHVDIQPNEDPWRPVWVTNDLLAKGWVEEQSDEEEELDEEEQEEEDADENTFEC